MKNLLSPLIYRAVFFSLLSFLTLSILSPLPLQASSPSDSLLKVQRSLLAKARSADDSIKILYDILDLSDRRSLRDAGRQLYAVAARAKRVDVQLDVARQMTATTSTPANIDSIISVVEHLPQSDDRDETILFLRMKKLPLVVRNSDLNRREADITKLLATFDESGSNTERLLKLYSVVEYMRNDLNGEMLAEALDDLSRTLAKGNFSHYYIPNVIYSESANIYSDADEHSRAVEADRKLLVTINGLKDKYRRQGRRFRNYDANEYISLRRMMSNFPALSDDSIQLIHQTVTALAERSVDVKRDLESNPRYYAYYYSAAGEWGKAIPVIKELLAKPDISDPEKIRLLSLLQTAAEKTGDKATLVAALSQSKELLEQLSQAKAIEKYKELQIRYEVTKYKRHAMEADIQKHQQEERSTRQLMSFILVGWILMALALMGLLFYWRKYRRTRDRVHDFASALADERNAIRDASYLDYGDHLGEPDAEGKSRSAGKKGKKGKKGFRFSSSESIAEEILNDTMYIASIGGRERQKQIVGVKLSTLVENVAQRVRPIIGPEVNFSIEPFTDVHLHTDRDCAEHVLFHILENAALHTEKGDITLHLSADEEAELVKFVITDTGIPLHPGEEQMLFENFINIEKLFSLHAPGMFLCRMASFLLNSSLKSASRYKDGSRFTFIIHTELN